MNPTPSMRCLAVALSWICVHTGNAQDETMNGKTVAGYRGIWFSLGQFYGPGDLNGTYSHRLTEPTFPYGDKYSGGLGTYTAKHTPLAIYAPEVDKTFFVYGGTTSANEQHLLCMISYYDHSRHRVPQPVVVHDKQGVDDPHDNPSLAIDRQGYLWVFISGRAKKRPGHLYRSREPYSIASFQLIDSLEMTYPQPHVLADGRMMLLFTKYTGVRELYWRTSPDGQSWTEDRKLAGIRRDGQTRAGHYQTSTSDGKRVGTFFNRHPNGNVDARTDLYYLQTDDAGESWTTVDGSVMEPSLQHIDSPAKVIDGSTAERLVYLKDMAFDQNGQPVLLYLTSGGPEPGPHNYPRQFRVIRWNGRRWRDSLVCTTDHNYDMGSLFLDQTRWRVIVPSDPGPQPHHGGGEIVAWESTDHGEHWHRVDARTRRSVRNHNYIRRPVPRHEPFEMFWADGDPTRLSPSRIYFSNLDGTRIWQLPDAMPHRFATPVEVTMPPSEP